MHKMQQLLVIIFLLVNGLYDIRHKKILGKSIVAFSVAILVCIWRGGEFSMQQQIFAWIPGVFLIVISYIFPEMIGMGDGICLLLVGCGWNVYGVINICFRAFLLAGLVGGVLLCVRKATHRTRLPFVPFLLVGTLLQYMKE